MCIYIMKTWGWIEIVKFHQPGPFLKYISMGQGKTAGYFFSWVVLENQLCGESFRKGRGFKMRLCFCSALVRKNW